MTTNIHATKGKTNGKTALVTGANSGIGFETAALLAEDGYSKVILAARTIAKANAAKDELLARVGRDVFDVLAVDVAEAESARQASAVLQERGETIDVLILNAGMSTGTERAYNSNDVELTFASTLIGHHVLTLRLLEANLLTAHARIVIAGSEGARGDLPGMNIPNFNAFASEHFNGNLEAALAAIARYEAPYEAGTMGIYVTAKVYVAWWAAALARRLPTGMAVNAVSPGSVPATNFARHMPFLMRRLMGPMMKLMGQAGSLADGARRYIDAGEFDDQTTGHFFASVPGKLVGPMEVQQDAHFLDQRSQEAAWHVISQLAGEAIAERVAA